MKFELENKDPDSHSLTIKIENLTKAQAVAIEELMAVWNFIGDKRFSLWTSFMCDGYADWNPIITVDNNEPQRYMGDIGLRAGKIKIVQSDESLVDDDMYFLDYMKIQENFEPKKENNE